MSPPLDRTKKDKAILKAARRRCDKARRFPTNTDGSSRHVQIMADCLTKKGGYPMLTEEPEHCAISLYSTVASLWEARTELERHRPIRLPTGAPMTQRLFRVTVRGFSAASEYKVSYAIAGNSSEAYTKVRDWLNREDVGFADEREMDRVELIAQDEKYPACKTRLLL